MAIAGASVIAIGPVAPTLPAAQDRAVELSAWIDPIGVWGDTIATTVQNLGTQGAGLLTEGLPAAWEIITTSSLYSEIASAVFNPAPGLERFFGNLSTYAATIKTGLEESNAGTAEHYAKLPAALQTAWDFVLQGQFTKAFATITSWSIFGLGELGWPLEPVFKIPGEIARDFGLTAVGAVLDTLLVSDNATTGYAYSLLSPPITAIYQLTDILNVVSASIYDGDWVTAVSEVVNAPAKVLNAFLNGYQPSVAAEWEFFPGVFSKDGPIDALFVQLPKAIAAALAALSEDDEADETGETTTAETELTQVSSTALGAEADLVTVAVTTDTDEEDAAAADEDGSTTVPTEPAPTDETAPADGETEDGETVTEPVDDGTDETTEAGAEEETEGSGDLAEDDTADTDTDNAGDPGAEDTPAGDTSDSGAGDTSDSGSGDTSDSDA